MSKELNCMNCCIGDFKRNLCDCNNGFCKEFKSIGKEEDFFNAVMQRIRPQGEWKDREKEESWATVDFAYCSECGQPIMHKHARPLWNFCPNCGVDMREVRDE